jgi:hypothetical protein
MKMKEYPEIDSQIDSLLKELYNEEGIRRKRARISLIHIGQAAVPHLIDVVQNEKGQARWEAIETLRSMEAPTAVPILIDALNDDDTGIRWAASNALIAQDRAALKPLFRALVNKNGFGSPRFRQGAHHILHALKDRHHLSPEEVEVFEALEGIKPDVEVPWTARAALKELENESGK